MIIQPSSTAASPRGMFYLIKSMNRQLYPDTDRWDNHPILSEKSKFAKEKLPMWRDTLWCTSTPVFCDCSVAYLCSCESQCILRMEKIAPKVVLRWGNNFTYGGISAFYFPLVEKVKISYGMKHLVNWRPKDIRRRSHRNGNQGHNFEDEITVNGVTYWRYVPVFPFLPVTIVALPRFEFKGAPDNAYFILECWQFSHLLYAGRNYFFIDTPHPNILVVDDCVAGMCYNYDEYWNEFSVWKQRIRYVGIAVCGNPRLPGIEYCSFVSYRPQ